MSIQLYEHQKKGVEIWMSNPRGYFYEWGMGSGKTMLSLASLTQLRQRGDTLKTLVVAPSAVIYSAWMNDAKHFPDLKCHVAWHSEASKRRKLMNEPCDVLVTTPDCFRLEWQALLETGGVGRMVFDEAGKLRNPSSNISKAAYAFSQRIRGGFYALSGNPAPNGAWEYWAIVRCICPELFGHSFRNFQTKYFAAERQQIGWKATPPIMDIMRMMNHPRCDGRGPLKWLETVIIIDGASAMFGGKSDDEPTTALFRMAESNVGVAKLPEGSERWIEFHSAGRWRLNAKAMRLLHLFKPGITQPADGYDTGRMRSCLEWLGRQAGSFANREIMFDKFEVDKEWKPIELWQPEFREKLATVCWPLKLEDCIDLPGEQDSIRDVELSSTEWEAYESLRKSFFCEIGSTAGMERIRFKADSITMKLRQAASGFVYVDEDDGGKSVNVFGRAIVDDLLLLLEEIGNAEQMVVWSSFRANADRISGALKEAGISHATPHGTPKQRGEQIEKFQRGETRVIVADPKSLGHGVNLWAAAHDYFFDLNWFPDDHKQARARTYRNGQTRKVIHHYAIPRGTVVERIYRVLNEKSSIEEEFKLMLSEERSMAEKGKVGVEW